MGKNYFVMTPDKKLKDCFHKSWMISSLDNLSIPLNINKDNCFGKHCCSMFVIDDFWK